MFKSSVLLFVLSMLPVAPVFAVAPITVSGAWVRLIPGDAPCGGYLTIHNNTDKPIRLTEVSGPDFKRIEMHHSMGMGGMSHMTPVKSVSVPAHGQFSFSPGGYHLMMWRGGELQVGEQVPLTLRFDDGWTVRATFTVKGAAG